ncbi:MAG: SDR family NAD(P)-dependent oxidoreductase [Alphaproteobacteria bacterium]|nr:SDR family NAD(P)-dependent oxidoreductase [Alphaproteobacteria bacterium]
MHNVLLTGAGGHVGFALTKKYHAEGWRVFATCLPKDRSTELEALAEQSKDQIRLFDMDVTDAEDISRVADSLKGQSIDVLFNVAGLTVHGDIEFGKTDYAMWNKHFAINTVGPMRICEAFAPHVLRSVRKIMMTISSRIGANPSYGFVGYRATKSAVSQVMFQVHLALRDQGVVACACHPGWVNTTNNGNKGALTPDQSAAMLFDVVDGLQPGDGGKFFEPDGSTLSIVTQQFDQKPYGMT